MSRFYPPSRPRAVEGGLVARSKRGSMAQHWWSERFVSVLEGMGMGSRLQRGRTYARKGQVVSLDLAVGSVTAQVQGSRARPYRVRIGIAAFGKSEWAQVEHELAGNAWYLAKLLAGEMPEDIEDVFADVGLALFPATAGDLSLDCTCPDWGVPCKHVAATFYLLAESFDDDPFRILEWRGRSREDLLDNLQAARSDDPAAAAADARASVPLEACLDRFFALQGLLPRTREAATGSSLLEQLPPVEVTLRGHSLTELLRPAYERPATG
ncbi:SWIM zinc finger family protein [Intrasporangium sp.]|uniref:SWIM zinc finger family protein n=1 Tax=Intrasporangium sp. TaxID=1925024 RepID=UPI003221ED84